MSVRPKFRKIQRIQWEHYLSGRDDVRVTSPTHHARAAGCDDDCAAPALLAPGRPVNGSQSRHSLGRGANRAYKLVRLPPNGRADLIEQVESGTLSARRALAAMVLKQTSGH